MKKFLRLFGLVSLAFSIVFLVSGCAGVSSKQAAFKSLDSVLTAGDTGIDVWRQYVHSERSAIAALQATGSEEDLNKALGKKNELLKREGKVSSAYYKYQDAAKTAIAAGAASADLSDTSQLVSALTSFLTLVTDLSK
jgi:isocitrate lyase